MTAALRDILIVDYAYSLKEVLDFPGGSARRF